MINWLEHQQVFIPISTLDHDIKSLERQGLRAVDTWIQTEDRVRLHAWFFPAKPGSEREHLVFLALHGNGGNISHRLDYYHTWHKLGVSILALDYRGYGASEGVPSEEGLGLDAQAAHSWLRARGFASQHIIALGTSLGGGVAAELACREKLGGLILQSTFTSLPDLACDLYPWFPVRSLCTIFFDTLSKLPRIRLPLLILHSRQDELVHYSHAEKLFSAAKDPKQLWPVQGFHNNTIAAGQDCYLEGMHTFLSRHFNSQPAKS